MGGFTTAKIHLMAFHLILSLLTMGLSDYGDSLVMHLFSRQENAVNTVAPNTHMQLLGLEITDEGDLCFFAELKIDPSDSEREICIPHMIESYLSVITNTSSAK